MTTATAQLNMRIDPELKAAAQKTADSKWVKLNTILNQFLKKFVENPHVVQVQQDFAMDEIFDAGFTQAIMSPKGKKTLQEIDALLDTVG